MRVKKSPIVGIEKYGVKRYNSIKDKIIYLLLVYGPSHKNQMNNLIHLHFGGKDGVILTDLFKTYILLNKNISLNYIPKKGYENLPRNNQISRVFDDLIKNGTLTKYTPKFYRLISLNSAIDIQDDLLNTIKYFPVRDKQFKSYNKYYYLDKSWLYSEPFSYKKITDNQYNFIIRSLNNLFSKNIKYTVLSENNNVSYIIENDINLFNLLKSALFEELLIYNSGYGLFGKKYDQMRLEINKKIDMNNLGFEGDEILDYFSGINKIDEFFKKYGFNLSEYYTLYPINIISRKTYLSLDELLELLTPFIKDRNYFNNIPSKLDIISQAYYNLIEIRCDDNEQEKIRNRNKFEQTNNI